MTDTIPEIRTQETPRGLTEREWSTLTKLLEKANLGNMHGPAVRVGREYVALTNLSLPRRDNTREDRQCDLVRTGESVWLTDDEAAKYLRHGDRDGRRVSVIRLKSEVENNRPPVAPPSLLSGPVLRPMTVPGGDGARPDPEGSTKIITQEVQAPESQVVPVLDQDALDILPGQAGAGGADAALLRQSVTEGADQDLMAAVKAQSGLAKGTRRQ